METTKSNRVDLKWKESQMIEFYLETIKDAIPFAKEQIKVMMDLIKASNIPINNVIDLGCGDGVLGAAVLDKFPDANVVFIDFAEEMIKNTKKRFKNTNSCCKFLQLDYSNKNWVNSLENNSFDVIISGFSIHHQPDKRKKEVYSEIFNLLKTEGIFINIEHIASKTNFGRQLHREIFVNTMLEKESVKSNQISKDDLKDEYFRRSDREEAVLTTVEKQLRWLEKIGFSDVDCYFKFFEQAVFGGRKLRS